MDCKAVNRPLTGANIDLPSVICLAIRQLDSLSIYQKYVGSVLHAGNRAWYYAYHDTICPIVRFANVLKSKAPLNLLFDRNL